MGSIRHLHKTLLLWGLCLGFALYAVGFLHVDGQLLVSQTASSEGGPVDGIAIFRRGRRGTTSSDLHAFFRPDWQRRFSRVKKIREDNEKIKQAFETRLKELRAVGRQYRCVNPHFDDDGDGTTLLNVYLNVPRDDFEAQDESNIVNRLEDGEIVTTTGPDEGCWIEHDAGGWSSSIIDGKVRLEPLEENSFQ
uniref:Uncharacterized protein n=1 Tax=Corethron hystrix TaxID=216773 RepID=A0A7S1G0U4_9STRA|mmetsp:Transcript_6719/g.14477  ORF Transcript_6719/g.14477 Transcript_6719/m.14477 type:complete len:193 (+) Transcript_6719:230-808(+)|eukprot:CAMPEP_0113320026 /NCGR_PEP_ID=MMETSP0010_2-20120614/13989_1 /TAXON_ID=216773 ORGANISM="Corethron hystrix, Strain 308" /NCGR_SAMPLE_ID=MMETSP0010_2 /ASSEMBLY_ACC=CAM_ASM_000155 /LENGTH=192 /DNA_ID=CAMNT_0000177705 /DNA_START=155 /DNA_END=733 /DNA_ORIENTATION=+ /assembly_acc=CAM_ASM_000155